MKFTKTIIATAFAVCATSALAAQSVDTYGRASPTPGTGTPTASIAGCAEGCHVSDVRGRSAFNVAGSKRSNSRSTVTVRQADVAKVFGRA